MGYIHGRKHSIERSAGFAKLPNSGGLKKTIEQSGAKILDVAVTDKASIVARLPVPEADPLVEKIVDVSAGRALAEKLQQEFI